jgi:Protein of unknown function (DUF2845)
MIGGARMTGRRLALAAALAALAPVLARADSLSCAGGIVSLGDSKLDLLGKCGRPALQERDLEDLSVVDARLGAGRRVVSSVERWTYDFGRSRFIQVVRLVAGKVAGVERGGYGYAQAAAPRERLRRAICEPAALDEGALALEILARCGEPAVVDAWDEELRSVEALGGDKVLARGVIVRVEVWTYDFGRNQFLRFVRIEGGKVTRVDTGSYGYAE